MTDNKTPQPTATPKPGKADDSGDAETARDVPEPRDESPAESLGHAIVEPILGSKGTDDRSSPRR